MTSSTWIDVGNKLPKFEEEVIAKISDEGKDPGFICNAILTKREMYCNREVWFRSNCGYGFTVGCKVSHWIPMPK